MKFMLLLLILLDTSCGYEQSNQAAATENQKTAADGPPSLAPQANVSPDRQGLIRDVDFRNFTYEWYPKWDYMLSHNKEFTLRNGKLDVNAPSGSNEPQSFELVNILYSDVTGDGVEDAIITIKMEVMGNAKPYSVFIYSPANKTPKLLWVHEAGDRADEGLRDVLATDNGLLIIEQYNADKMTADDGLETKVGMCCPKTFTRTFYAWRGKGFRIVKSENLPNDFPDARVLVGLK